MWHQPLSGKRSQNLACSSVPPSSIIQPQIITSESMDISLRVQPLDMK